MGPMMYANQGAGRPERSALLPFGLRRRWATPGRLHRRTHVVRACAAIVLLGTLLWSGPAAARWRTFTTSDGLAGDVVRGLAEALDEAMWFATTQGVSRYDGTRWRTYTTADGLASNNCTCVMAARDGSIWVGTFDAGVTRITGDVLETFDTTNHLTHNNVWSITEDRDGRVWIATQGGGANWYAPETRTWGTVRADFGGLPSDIVLAVLQDHNGAMWFGTLDAGAYTAPRQYYNVGNWLPSNRVRKIVEDRDHGLWFITDNGVARRDASGNWRTFTEADGLLGRSVNTALADRDGRVWFGSRTLSDGSSPGGISRFDGRRWRTYSDLDGYFNAPLIWDVIQDRSGNLWFGTGKGAARYDGVTMTTFPEVTGLNTDVFNPHQDRKGNLWFGTEASGFFIFDGDSAWTNFYLGNGGAQIAEDHAGNLWVPVYMREPGERGGVVLRDTTGAIRWYTTADGLASNSVRVTLEAEDHSIWAAGTGGISHFDPTDSTWTAYDRYNTDGALPDDNLFSVFQDRDGAVWFGSFTGGAARRTPDGVWRNFGNTDGLGAPGLSTRNFVLHMRQDDQGYYWFSTPGAGMNRFQGEPTPGAVQHFTTADGLQNNEALTSYETRDGNVWIAFDHGGGAMRWDGSSLRRLGVEDGLPNGSVHFFFEDRDGDLWITTGFGVARYERDFVPPRTSIVIAPPAVSASRSQSAAFGALGETDGLVDPPYLEYAYRLDGAPWSEWSTRAGWSEQDLTDDVHTLEVRARDYWSNTDATPEVAVFEIDATPPLPAITSPVFGSPVQGTVQISGNATDARFAGYQVWVRPAGAGSWQGPEATRLVQSTTRVAGGTLAIWNTADLADGSYELRLSVTDTLGLEGAVQVAVVVDNEAPFFDQTAPITVTAAAGGNVYTTDAGLHLYVPPHAFAQDAVVTIAPLGDTPPALPGDAEPLGPAYDIAFGAARLDKPAMLELSLAGVDLGTSGQVPALYHSADGTGWSRLGGTVAAGRLSLAITEAGRYALYRDAGGGAGGSLTALTFTPRVFSPSGGFASRDVAIGFTLGRPGAVTVRVYNRAGRLVREVESGRTMGAGANLVRWDGRDRDGDMVTDGLYMVTVEALGTTQRRTLAVVR